MSIESDRDWEGMRRAGRVVRLALAAMRKQLRPGVTTAELDHAGARVLEEHGARSAPRALYGFPGDACISVNDEIVHGVPGGRVLAPGDLVKLDVTAELDGYIADSAVTVAVPPATEEAKRLMACARRAFERALEAARAGNHTGDIGRAVEAETRRHGFHVVRDLNGHGVGRAIHEDPVVPNYYHPSFRAPLTEGLVITIEPLIATRRARFVEDADGWTLRTSDGALAAHHEHTLVITRGRPVLLTAA